MDPALLGTGHDRDIPWLGYIRFALLAMDEPIGTQSPTTYQLVQDLVHPMETILEGTWKIMFLLNKPSPPENTLVLLPNQVKRRMIF